MAAERMSFRCWLDEQIREALWRKLPHAPLLIWCDPERTWRALLLNVAAS